ncbi:acyl-CoA--sterol O-acyltransferase 1-like [Mercurialis annua]|uniref:acyl-CoA--sterol O-acyltransferase 1-like n=1 Tax=Mercurialis annua TaxID=3986 RepID=UPI0021602942|nr:acyl-CoA--sterol O-acyltransferase 1-like [Mercurialis annua]
MEEEFYNSKINPIALLLASLAYCYYLATYIPKGFSRVTFIFPVFYIFYIFPWNFHSSLLRGIFSFFITWITSFKLLLFSFDQGSLFACENYLDFVLVSVFPIKIKEDNPSKTLKYELVQLFNKPYFATSLQDFWGRRWNRLSSNILRQTIYNPTQDFLKGILGIKAAKILSLIITLVVSGIMHELMFYYITCGKKPTWEVTKFFVLQGICIVCEVCLKYWFRVRVKSWKRFDSKGANILTMGFILITCYWGLVLPVWRSGQNKCT